ncbi:hypothetical protein D9M70_593660 [compost metagenome]
MRVIFIFSSLARSAKAGSTTLLSPALVKPLAPTTILSSIKAAAVLASMIFENNSGILILSFDIFQILKLQISGYFTIFGNEGSQFLSPWRLTVVIFFLRIFISRRVHRFFYFICSYLRKP